MDLNLGLVISKLRNFICLIELFLDQPLFHLVHTLVVHVLLTLSVLEQLLPNFSLFLLNQFLFEPLFCVFESNPLLKIWRLPICMHSPSTAPTILLGNKAAPGAIDNRAFIR